MVSLQLSAFGLDFAHCFMNASGARCETQEQLHALGQSNAAAIVIKSASLEPRSGNPEPRYFENQLGTINSMGLPNLGYRKYCELVPELKRFGKPVIASVAGFSQSEFDTMVSAYDAANVDLIEVNLSCPNIAGKSQACYDIGYSEKILESVRNLTSKPMTVKLSPFLDISPREEMARLLKKTKMNAAVLINSVGNALIVNPQEERVVIKPKLGMGGLGGMYVKPIALANVFTFYQVLKDTMPVIGCGGIQTGWDAFEHILCGATLVQIGSTFQSEGTRVFDRLPEELSSVIKQKGYNSLDDFRGKLKFIE